MNGIKRLLESVDVIKRLLESVDVIGLFQSVLVPVIMISGIGLFILIIQTRYGRIVDRIRSINYERLELIKSSIIRKISKTEKIWNNYRLQALQEQMSILVKRGKLLKYALQFMFISIFTSIFSSLLLFIEQITKIPMSSLILILFSIGMIMLLMACINVIREVTSSYKAVIFDIDTHVPEKYRIKTELGVLGHLEKDNSKD
ncbi:MAG: DUF2721 domain-containing protein [Candidatus Bathyarchaeota archaeon]|nr:DUF2721 domain-containing protein [Candidatus Bathyarchaeota archaeon]